MKFTPTKLPEVILIEPAVFRDPRGFFMEFYQAKKFAEGGVKASFVQDNHSCSVQGALRGLHGQSKNPQGKLVRVIRGEIFDVALDVRKGSPTFGKWVGYTLSSENFRQMYVPPGFLHGFCVLSEMAEVEYKCTDFYNAADEIGVRWNDPELKIEWPISNPVLSEKDKNLPLLSELADRLPAFAATPAR